MDFPYRVLRGISLIPAVVNSIEGLFGDRCGSQKKEAAVAFVVGVMQVPRLVAKGEITDETRFREGLAQMINGAVECLNAAGWRRHSR